MRILAELPHPVYKITLMQWNDRYFIKIEHFGTELIFKFREGPLMDNEVELRKFMDEEFYKDIDKVYEMILQTRQKAIERQEKRIYGE